MLISGKLVAMLKYSQIYFPYVKAKNKLKTKKSKPPPPRKKKTNKQTKNKETKNKNKLRKLTLYFIFSLFINKVDKLLLALLIHHLLNFFKLLLRV